MDNNDSGLLRFPEIIRMLAACGRSIHDVSRVQLDRASRLPRFNMPLELGADLGLRFAGSTRQRRRKSLILDSEPHRYDQTLSDLSGMDIGSHANDTQRIIGLVRDWLNSNRVNDHSPLPGAVAINADHDAYLRLAPDIISNLRLDRHDDLPHGDYLHVVRIALPIIEKARVTPAVN